MGPLETMDLTGVDVFVNAARNVYADTVDPKFYPPELTVRMAAAGDHGRKTGRGWYEHA
jgi:3-hydroxybutyryl-CoA dehydrogenase